MANTIPLSPAELSYLHTSLSQTPPIRPDGRSPTQFRPLVAETDILPSANGSARICFADGTEAIVGVKAEVEKSSARPGATTDDIFKNSRDQDGDVDVDREESDKEGKGRDEWLEIAIEIPGMRDDDSLPVFLSAMLTEALLSDGGLKDRLWINSRFHWRLYIDILLLSQPRSYPLPLLSLTTHLALISTRIPALISEHDEDPLFNDDWEASTFLYPRSGELQARSKPPVTLLVVSIGEAVLFDPSRDELAVCDSAMAISVAQSAGAGLKVVALRMIDPPSRLTAGGVPQVLNSTSNPAATASLSPAEALVLREKDQGQTVWRPPRGGVRRAIISRIIKMVVENNGVGEEVIAGLAGVEA
ncbi:Hypothetical protein R9X50_00238300 [Acrodontium crateriforme]|uniref:Ribosomal RNA-processing protein 42 n=1 Tax=Acrodontium crateriforme TaxID=150365 RepID=A0AAQ3M6U7_9PEZI|nr:Hypothetical protein R9X50_00238300 [Acrodontium crateriforme]